MMALYTIADEAVSDLRNMRGDLLPKSLPRELYHLYGYKEVVCFQLLDRPRHLKGIEDCLHDGARRCSLNYRNSPKQWGNLLF